MENRPEELDENLSEGALSIGRVRRGRMEWQPSWKTNGRLFLFPILACRAYRFLLYLHATPTFANKDP
jgi:hypothetical protein